jgi:glutamate-5-semialdehyde dehydrogenase
MHDAMNDHAQLMRTLGTAARAAGRVLARTPSPLRDRVLLVAADGIEAAADDLRRANRADLEDARAAGIGGALLDRLELTDGRIAGMAAGLREVAALEDPVGEIAHMRTRPNGLRVGKMRIPLGVVAMIYESRPNVTAEAGALCLKSGNAVILRGGKEALRSNQAIAARFAAALDEVGLPAAALQVVPTTDRAFMAELLKAEDWVDVLIPRGGEGLIRYVAENARVPVIKHYKGVCHVYVDAGADLDTARAVCENAKVQRPSTCNAAETLLVHREVAEEFLPGFLAELASKGVELRGDEAVRALYPAAAVATEEDWHAEYLDLVLAVRTVDSLDAAIQHIQTYGSDHTEAIVTRDHGRAMRFLQEVDSSVVLVNASTRFADGRELGLGAEMGISTSRLHAYGPMGVEALTTEKFVVFGDGQIRGTS